MLYDFSRFGTRFDTLEDWHSYFPADMDTIGEKTSVGWALRRYRSSRCR